MQPIEEYGHGKGHAYGVPAGPWHQVYDGRSDVQLTWEANYKKATLTNQQLSRPASPPDCTSEKVVTKPLPRESSAMWA